MRKMKIISIVLCWVLFALSNSVTAQTITIDLSNQHQVIQGFGGANIPAWIGDLTQDQTDKVFENGPGRLGLSLLRVRIPNDSSRFDIEVPTAARVEKYGVKVFGTPWSPPAYMKSNDNLVGGYLLPSYYGNFADHLLNFASYMKSNGAPLYAVSLQNEPDIRVAYESCSWTAKQFNNFLEQEGSKFDSINLIAPESYHFDSVLTDSILRDSMAAQYVNIVGGHIYGSGLYDHVLARQMGKDVWMTEHITDSKNSANLWPLALGIGTEINKCMEANFNAYVWWYIRRFYGLIDDAGNLTKRGYVMSQFSKFIRPGFTRVDVATDTAVHVDVSAYKSDSSFVIVVINNNSTPAALNFTIQNGTVDTLTKFTTSATKDVHNDGMVVISGGTLNDTVDASSITTFTSYAADGERYGNVPPVANAGGNIDITDTSGLGYKMVTLDGSASHDPDGNIINYNWSMDGTFLSSDTSLVVKVTATDSSNAHSVVLAVTDNDGATSYDTINVLVRSIYSTEKWFEAECGQIGGSNWETIADNKASGGKYVTVTPGIQSLTTPTSDSNNITFPFHVSEAGPYKVWCRVIDPTANDDSYWVKMDNTDNDTTWVMWNSIAGGSSWHWDEVRDQNNTVEMIYPLDTGNHVLSICYREDGALLDKVYITNTGKTPTGMGGTATNCPPQDTTGTGLEITGNEAPSITVFPNPAHSDIHIRWNSTFSSLAIFDMQGRKVLEKLYSSPVRNTYLSLHLKPGIYFMRLNNSSSSGFVKVIIE